MLGLARIILGAAVAAAVLFCDAGNKAISDPGRETLLPVRLESDAEVDAGRWL